MSSPCPFLLFRLLFIVLFISFLFGMHLASAQVRNGQSGKKKSLSPFLYLYFFFQHWLWLPPVYSLRSLKVGLIIPTSPIWKIFKKTNRIKIARHTETNWWIADINNTTICFMYRNWCVSLVWESGAQFFGAFDSSAQQSLRAATWCNIISVSLCWLCGPQMKKYFFQGLTLFFFCFCF